MIRLDSATRKLTAVLSSAVATSQCNIVVGYVDKSAYAPAGGLQNTLTNGVTAVDICIAPAGNTFREIDNINVYNADTASVNITIRLNDNGVNAPLVRATLLTMEQLTYVEGSGWKTLDANGNLKQAASSLVSLMVGTASASLPIVTVSNNVSIAPTPLNGTLVQLVGADAGGSNRFAIDAFSVQTSFSGRRANGTNAAKTALLSNDVILNFACFGYGATAYSASVRGALNMVANENWTDVAQGTRIDCSLTANGAASAAAAWTCTQTAFSVTGTLSTGGYTVSGLPAGTVGQRAYVTDATAPTFLGALTGGGTVKTPVFYNGVAWVAG